MAENQVDASLRSLFNPCIITRNPQKNAENVDCLFRNIFFEVSVDSVLVVLSPQNTSCTTVKFKLNIMNFFSYMA